MAIDIMEHEVQGMLTHKQFKAQALKRPAVMAEYDRLEEEFAVLDEFLKLRAAAGLTQAQLARETASARRD